MENMMLVASLVMSFVFTIYDLGFFSDENNESKKINNDKAFKNDFIAFIYITFKLCINVVYFLVESYFLFKLINTFALFIYYSFIVDGVALSSELLFFSSLAVPVGVIAISLNFLRKKFKRDN